MSYFLPSFVQKRLFKYALSRFELIDTDALDLDSLGITWGQRSTFELNSIGLRLEKLTSTLQLPPKFEFDRAQISLARVTIPADIYSSAIQVEASGVEVVLKLRRDKDDDGGKARPETDDQQDLGGILPSTADLAQSFLESEPKEETEELQAALSQQSDVLSDDGDEDSELGLHDGVSLPSFIAGFLQGISDRLQLSIKDVSVRVEMEMEEEAAQKDGMPTQLETISGLFTIDNISIEGVAPDGTENGRRKPGKRLVTLSRIHAMLVSDEGLFSNYSRFNLSNFSGDQGHRGKSPMPVEPQASTSLASSLSPAETSSSSSSMHQLAQSTIFGLQDSVSNEVEEASTPQALQSSFLSDDGRFSDPDSDDDEPPDEDPPAEYLQGLDDQYEDRHDYTSLQDTVYYGTLDTIDDSTTLPSGQRREFDNEASATPRAHSPESPSQSMYSQFHSVREEYSSPVTSKILDDDIRASTISTGESSTTPTSHDSSNKDQEDGPAQHSSGPDDLSESKIFSHDEARSIYMSVMSHHSTDPVLDMPGGWGSDPYSSSEIDSQGGRSSTPTLQLPESGGQDKQATSAILHQEVHTESDAPVMGQGTPAERPPFTSNSGRDSDVLKRILEIQEITIWLPSLGKSRSEEPPKEPVEQIKEPALNLMDSTILGLDSSEADLPHKHVQRDSLSSTPGAKVSQKPELIAEEAELLTAEKKAQAIEVEISSIHVRADIACGWLLVKVVDNISAALDLGKSGISEETAAPPKDASPLMPISLRLASCSIKLLGDLPSEAQSHQRPDQAGGALNPDTIGEAILHADISDVKFQSLAAGRTMNYQVIIGKFTLGHMSEALISFDESLKMRESTRDILSPIPRDVSLTVVKSPESTTVNLTTLPVHLSLNLKTLDESINWIGGLSTLFDFGSPVTSTATVKTSRPDPARRPRVVHFENAPAHPPPAPSGDSTATKANVRIGGIVVHLLGEDSHLKFETTAVKIIGRSAALGLQVDRAKLTGPHNGLLDSFLDGDTAATVRLSNIRIEYVNTPSETDLDRLLTLLTPSKDKYDDNDDIMLDTLFRQRRKGAVLRLSTGETNVEVASIHGLRPLTHLTDEISKLSRVAQYLPQNDTPGILMLTRIKELQVQVSIGGQVGDIILASQATELGYVSFPSLVACRVSTISINRGGSEELLAPAIPHDLSDKPGESPLPMLMARFIADEIDPTIKLKIFNMRVEYTIDSITAFMGLNNDEATAEVIAANMAHSVLNLAELSPLHQTSELGSPSLSEKQTAPSPLKLSATLRDCIIGLNPLKSSAKALVVFTNAQFSGAIKEDGASEANIDVRRASMMLIDSTEHVGLGSSPGSKRPNSKPGAQVRALEQMGYVSVCSISSASVAVKIIQSDDKEGKLLDVELRDDLLILETCADSTQTLISVLSGLAPPTPPTKETKYRTETVPLEDMLNFIMNESGVAEDGADTVVNDALADVEEEKEPEDESEYVSDFHPYISSVKDQGFHDDDLTSQMVGENDRLATNFQSNTLVSSDLQGLDFQDNHFARKSAVEGTAHRWDASRNIYSLSNEVKLHGSPLRVRVRDVHFIWNLYDGYDWQGTRDAISKLVKDVQSRATEKRTAGRRVSRDLEDDESVVGDFLFNSVYIEIPPNSDPRDISHDINRNIDDRVSETASFATTSTMPTPSNQAPVGKRERLRLSRSKHHKMTIELTGISGDLVLFPEGFGETQSSMDIRIHDLEIFDHMPTSDWKTFATYMKDYGEREIGTSMVHLEVLNVKPVADLAASELILKANVLPLRLHVDQDALDFLSRFFEFKDESTAKDPEAGQPSTAPSDEIFVQRAEINAIPVKLDFNPKRVDYAGLKSGRTTEFMNFFALDGAEMTLNRVILYGVSGLGKLGQMLNDIWMPDVKSNQLSTVLAGLAPVRSLVKIGGGIKDLVVIPIREYKKDGRIVRSFQKGAASFAKTTTNELVKLGAKLALGTQNALQSAEVFLNGAGGSQSRPPTAGSDDSQSEDGEKRQISIYADQPIGVAQGLRGGYVHLGRDLLTARDAVIAVPGEVMECETAAQAAKALWKRAPTVILRPAIGATGAVGRALLGAGNTLDPENKRRADEKYKQY